MTAALTLLLLLGGGGTGLQGSDEVEKGLVIQDVYESEHGVRPYRLYLPPAVLGEEDLEAKGEGAAAPPLLVVLHGCTQDAEDVARGTRMDDHGRRRGMAVLYPEQPPEAHATRCWNWYEPDHQSAGGGEPAILAGMIREMTETWGLDSERVYVAGISAGGAMAVTLAATHPGLVSGVASHSGVAYRAAVGLEEATRVLSPAEAEPSRDLVEAVSGAMGERGRRIPLLVIHGDDDAVVAPRNARWLADQWAGLAEEFAEGVVEWDMDPSRPQADQASRIEVVRDDGGVWMEMWRIRDLGHAWSGGSDEGTFTQPGGLDASALIVDFMLGRTP